MAKKSSLLSSTLSLFLVFTAMTHAQQNSNNDITEDSPPKPAPPAESRAQKANNKATAISHLSGKNGSEVKGDVAFEEAPAGLKINYKIEGLKPNRTFGFHVHENGDCSSADAKSAGPHYAQIANSGGTASDSPARHAGDLPEIKSDDKGVAQGSVVVPRLSVDDQYGIKGRAIVVHDGPDNPRAPSPPRIACGVIEQSPTTTM